MNRISLKPDAKEMTWVQSDDRREEEKLFTVIQAPKVEWRINHKIEKIVGHRGSAPSGIAVIGGHNG